MLTDREFAAKAAGLELLAGTMAVRNAAGVCYHWDPENDDGDALRLAVALQATKGAHWVICLSIGDNRTACEFHYASGGDPATNTRHAIYRAAVEIGRTMTC